MAQAIPRPFENSSVVNSGDSYSRGGAIIVNGQTIEVSIYEESDFARWTFKLPSGATASHETTLDAKNQFEKEEVNFKDSSGRVYSYSFTKEGTHQFTRQDGDGPKTILSKKDFQDSIKGIIAPYDPKYMAFFEASLAKADIQKINPLDGIKRGQTIRITTDGKAAIMEEVRPHQAPRVIGTFLNEAQIVASVSSQKFRQETPTQHFRGNVWNPQLYDILKAIPKEERTKLQRAMNEGSIILEVNELRGKPVCQTLTGKPKKGEPDICKR